MTRKELSKLINDGREIEFVFNSKNYSITYYNDSRENYISFCEFYKETSDVKNVNELCEIEREGIKVIDMLLSLDDNSITIF